MEELLAKLVDVVTTYPALAAGVAVATALAAFAWAVVSSSYRYR